MADSLFLMLVMGSQLELPLHNSFNVKVKKEKLRKAKNEQTMKNEERKTKKSEEKQHTKKSKERKKILEKWRKKNYEKRRKNTKKSKERKTKKIMWKKCSPQSCYIVNRQTYGQQTNQCPTKKQQYTFFFSHKSFVCTQVENYLHIKAFIYLFCNQL